MLSINVVTPIGRSTKSESPTPKRKTKKPSQPSTVRKQQEKRNKEHRMKGMVVLPYIKGTTEVIQMVMKQHKIGTSVKPHRTLRNELVHPKDKIDNNKKSQVVYEIPCKNCKLCYIGETGRQFGQRLGEHRKEADKITNKIYTRSHRRASEQEINKSAVTDYASQANHVIDWEAAKCIVQEDNRYRRWIQEAIWIRSKASTMNRDEGHTVWVTCGRASFLLPSGY